MNPLRFCHFVCVGTFLLLLINLTSVAQEPRVLTLANSIEIAKKSNLTVQTAEQNLKTAEAQVRSARAGLLPRITANGNYTYFKDVQKSVIQAEGGFGFPMPGEEMDEMAPPSADNESELIELEFGAHHNVQGTLSLTQPVFAWGRYYYGYQAAKLNYQAVQRDLDAAYNQLRLDVSEAFYAVLIAQEFVRVAQQSVALVEKQLGIAEASLKAGAATNFDVLRAKVQLANAKSQLVRAENAIITAKNAYKTVLNIPLAEDVSVKGALEVPEKHQMLALNLDTLIEQALKNRPEVRRTQLSEQAAHKQVDIAKTRSRPDLGLFTNYQISQNERLTQMNRIWSVGFQINIPIFDGFATRAAVQQSESTLKQIQLGGTQVKVGVEFEVRNAYLNLLGAQTLIDVQREAVAQAQESVRIANLQFQNGIITTVALTDTQLALAQAEVNRLQAYHDYVVGLARLEKAIGQTLQQ
ncbi:TolC family protein [Candidatus Poribacteria bacterium]|nr:TolC family protein [Candidatus Poribacteria bacterium]MYK22010.1 TolC family protein [Candidatus Poribacteria bacterium]